VQVGSIVEWGALAQWVFGELDADAPTVVGGQHNSLKNRTNCELGRTAQRMNMVAV
jgi:hypothetical protein